MAVASDLDAAGPEGGTEDSGAGATGPTGSAPPTGATGGGPGVYDGGPPAVIGGGTDGGKPVSGGDAAPDAPVSCGSPGGTYAQSCSGCAVAGTTLTCECKTDSGSSVSASLNLCDCPVLTEISNANGVLSCCGSPAGSYTSSCTSCKLTGTILACTCITDSGAIAATSLDICTCTQATKIANTNGQLTCP